MQQSNPVGAVNQPKPADAFRNFAAEERPSVREFYRQNHLHQTVDFVRAKKREYLSLDRRTMRIWEALEYPEFTRGRQRPRHRPHPD